MSSAGSTRELVALVGARSVSVLGDQFARVALSALVLDRTGSPLLAALAFAATFVPAVLGTALLSGLADRRPRRTVLVAGDLLRGALVTVMVLASASIPALLGLVLLVTLVDGPAGAARGALLRQLAGDDARYQRVTAWDETCTQTGQVGGYLLGGLAVLGLGPQPALLLNAASFLLSALVVRVLVRHRGAAAADDPAASRTRRALQDVRTGLGAVLRRPARLPVLLTWIGVTAAVAPEGLALAWARDLSAGAAGAGLLLAANPVGSVLGLLLLTRTDPGRARRSLVPLVAVALGPLLLAPWVTGLVPAALLVGLSGAGLTYTTVARTVFSGVVPDAVRGRAFGVAATGLVVGQGLGFAAAGAVAEFVSPGAAVGATAAVGLLAALLVVLVDRGPRGRHLARGWSVGPSPEPG